VIAMLVTPGCIGFLLADRFTPMLIVAAIAAVLSSILGVYVSFFIEGSTAACIVLVQSLIFVLVLCFAPKRGLLMRRRVDLPNDASLSPQRPVG
jgi:manganese/iron transport system permease protein